MMTTNVMINEWITQLLERNNLASSDNLTKDMVCEEIADTKGSIGNEKLWALGVSGDESREMHLGNIENLEDYTILLEKLLLQAVA